MTWAVLTSRPVMLTGTVVRPPVSVGRRRAHRVAVTLAVGRAGTEVTVHLLHPHPVLTGQTVTVSGRVVAKGGALILAGTVDERGPAAAPDMPDSPGARAHLVDLARCLRRVTGRATLTGTIASVHTARAGLLLIVVVQDAGQCHHVPVMAPDDLTAGATKGDHVSAAVRVEVGRTGKPWLTAERMTVGRRDDRGHMQPGAVARQASPAYQALLDADAHTGYLAAMRARRT